MKLFAPKNLNEYEIEQRRRVIKIDQMLAQIDEALANRDRERQEIRLAPWQLALTGMTAGAALFAAGAAFVKLLGL